MQTQKLLLVVAVFVGLLKLQANNWQKDIGYSLRFIICGFFTFSSFSIYEVLHTAIIGRENSLLNNMFGNCGNTAVMGIVIILGYFGLYCAVIATALFESLLPKK